MIGSICTLFILSPALHFMRYSLATAMKRMKHNWVLIPIYNSTLAQLQPEMIRGPTWLAMIVCVVSHHQSCKNVAMIYYRL